MPISSPRFMSMNIKTQFMGSSRSVGPLYISCGPLVALRDGIYSVRNPTPEAPPPGVASRRREGRWVGHKKTTAKKPKTSRTMFVGHTLRSALSLFSFHTLSLWPFSSPGPTHLTNTQPKECNSELKAVQRLLIAETLIGPFLFLFTSCVVSGCVAAAPRPLRRQ